MLNFRLAEDIFTPRREHHMMRKTMMALSILLLLDSQAGAGQTPKPGPGKGGGMQHSMGQGMMMCSEGMGSMMMSSTDPAMLLRAAEVLGLNARQKTTLQAIQTRHASTIASNQQQAKTAHQKLGDLLNAERPDLAAFEAALNQASTFGVNAHVAMARAAVEARAVLSKEQREKANSLASMMHGGRGGGMCPGAAH
jgi:Spy/CpxP family protein refolding chaperone